MTARQAPCFAFSNGVRGSGGTESDESTGPEKVSGVHGTHVARDDDDGGANDGTTRHKGRGRESGARTEGCFVLDQRRGTCQLGTGTGTFLKKGGEEEESTLRTLMNERDCSAIRKLDRRETLQYSAER